MENGCKVQLTEKFTWHNTPTHKPVAIGRASLGDLGRCSFLEDRRSPLLPMHPLYPEAKGGGCHSSCRVVTGQGALGC